MCDVDLHFEWNDEKARRNLAKHGISFDVAQWVFRDLFRVECLDDRIYGEDRFVTIGVVSERPLVVVFSYRGEAVRIISARKAERDEIYQYWQNRTAQAQPH